MSKGGCRFSSQSGSLLAWMSARSKGFEKMMKISSALIRFRRENLVDNISVRFVPWEPLGSCDRRTFFYATQFVFLKRNVISVAHA